MAAREELRLRLELDAWKRLAIAERQLRDTDAHAEQNTQSLRAQEAVGAAVVEVHAAQQALRALGIGPVTGEPLKKDGTP
jgi:hypothetical protein